MMAWLTGVGRDGPLDDHELLGRAGVADEDLHHEPVDLRLGQRIGALGLDRVLGGHDQERPGHAVGLPADGHLLLLHHLQQRALHLGRRPVDLVGQQQVGEHRPERDLELAAALVVDPGADEVGRHQVGGELDPVELPADRPGERLHGQRLGQAGHALDEDVPAGQQRDQQPLEQHVLADDGLLDLVQHLLHRVGRRRPDRWAGGVSTGPSFASSVDRSGHCCGSLAAAARRPTAAPMGTAKPMPMNVPALGRVGQRHDDADRLALGVDQRAAGAARVDRGVELDQPGQVGAVVAGRAAVQAGHHARGGAVGQAERVADGDHAVADGEPAGVAEHRRHQHRRQRRRRRGRRCRCVGSAASDRRRPTAVPSANVDPDRRWRP